METHEQFLMDAVLSYDDADAPARRGSARALLGQHPELPRLSIWAAAAAGDHRALAGFLAADPASARLAGGPKSWEPLLYLTYSRLDPVIPAADVENCLRLLLDAGADPNAGFLSAGGATPFTALTGLFGGGEQGGGEQRRGEQGGGRQGGGEQGGGEQGGSDQDLFQQDSTAQPAHPHQHALASLLLRAGADPNDGQALYNRMFGPADDHLELLFQFGLGSGDGGPWHRRNPLGTDTPEQMVRAQLAWAVTKGSLNRIDLLARHGVELGGPLDSGHLPMRTVRTPLQLAVVAGRPESAAKLRELGVDEELDPATELVGALLAADVERAAWLETDHPDLFATVRRANPSLILRATVINSPDAMELLARRGFDVNALGRADIAVEQPWETALHQAAGTGSVDLVRLLLRLGADQRVRDHRFGATPLEWAQFFDHRKVITLLA